jgi:polysaccharide export outer membrane protein
MRFLSLLCFVAVFATISCRTQKNISNNYLQDTRDTTIKDSAKFALATIQKGDLLSIKIFSEANGINPALDAPYNLAEVGAGATGTSSGGFLVDQSGNIEYPQLGVLHVEGLTREQVAALIKSKLSGTQLTNPSVVVRFLNYRITVLGEVNSPGTFTLPAERVTILEALGLAGDVTRYGKRTTVKVIRENEDEREIGTIDLTSTNMFSSPYFRLRQNDIVLVEETGKKAKQEQQQTVAQQIGIATSVIATLALIITIIKN